MKSSLTAVVLTFNNESIITRCLQSLAWVSEVIVVDNFSTDDTVKIAKKLGAKVIQHSLNNNWSAQRNFGLKQASHDWVLFIDSDEVLTPALKFEIIKSLKQPKFSGFLIHRTDKFLNQTLRHGETGHIKLLRLANRRYGLWQRRVHEVWKIKGKVGELKNPLLHDRDLNLSDFLLRLDRYTSLETFDFHWLDLLKPKIKFIVNYFFKLGLLDGFAGFIMAYFMSLNSIIVRVKSWEKSHR